jgi:hypothetical protein
MLLTLLRWPLTRRDHCGITCMESKSDERPSIVGHNNTEEADIRMT